MAVWPQVVQHVLDAAPALWPTAATFDGPPNTGDDPTDYVTVGFVADDVAGSFTQTREHDFLVAEDGLVRLELTAQTGDAVLTDVRPRVFAMLDALDAHIRADQTLGGLVFGPVLLAADGVLTVSNEHGVAMSIVCSLTYHTESAAS